MDRVKVWINEREFEEFTQKERDKNYEEQIRDIEDKFSNSTDIDVPDEESRGNDRQVIFGYIIAKKCIVCRTTEILRKTMYTLNTIQDKES